MVNVNGVNVRLVNAAPKRVARGWLHSTSVYLVEALNPVSEYLGSVEAITSARHGGVERDRWAQVGTWARGRTILGGNLNDLIAAAMVEREHDYLRSIES